MTSRIVAVFVGVVVSSSGSSVAQSPGPAGGLLSGVVSGDDGTALEGATITAVLVTAGSKSRIIGKRRSALSGSGGRFAFSSLPYGTYNICSSAAQSIWLNPCEWDLQRLTATLSEAPASVVITMKKGAQIRVVVEDPKQLVLSKKSSESSVLIGVTNAISTFTLAALSAQDISSRTYMLTVPFGRATNVIVLSSQFKLNLGPEIIQPNTARHIPVLIQAGQVAPVITVTVGSSL